MNAHTSHLMLWNEKEKLPIWVGTRLGSNVLHARICERVVSGEVSGINQALQTHYSGMWLLF